MAVPATPIRKMSEDEREDLLQNARDDVAPWPRE
jgi:hypothetical protein